MIRCFLHDRKRAAVHASRASLGEQTHIVKSEKAPRTIIGRLCGILISGRGIVSEKVLPFVEVSHGYPQPLKVGGNVPMKLSVCESNVHCPMRKHFHGLFMTLQLQHRDVRRLHENKPHFDLLAAALSFSEPHGV
ncbi:MAG: hypothetical protein LIO63_03205 [Akkermansia sp.]|nr:hypothetical protein [Akkermansia sp.]MCD8070966.1 hypothetical protein [Akkermansiaceae bacterium]